MKLFAASLAAALLAAPAALAQHQPGTYLTSQELVLNQPARPGVVGPLHVPAHHLEVVVPSTHAVHRVPLTHAWGYADVQGQAYRLVRHQAYAIRQRDSLVVYSRPRTVHYGKMQNTFTEYFYSRGLDGELRPLTRRGLKQQFVAANPTFLRLLAAQQWPLGQRAGAAFPVVPLYRAALDSGALAGR